MASMDHRWKVLIRNLVRQDPVALLKWTNVVDNVVSSADDARRINNLLGKDEYGEAILQTLDVCSCDLVGVLRRHELNSLADNIAAKASGSRPASNFVWYNVDELPCDFSGRASELNLIHKRLSLFHSNQSVHANLVCISGPPGAGKSTLARKYAFDNYSFYDGNVIWIDAGSLESMRSSYQKLATSKLGVPIDESDRTLADNVYEFFQHGKCLFIFDDVREIEDFMQFRPKIVSPAFFTPYLLITSRKIGLVPSRENEVRIFHQTALIKIEQLSKFASELLKLLAYLNHDKITVRFLQQTQAKGGNFEESLTLLQNYHVIELQRPVLIVHPSVQEVIRSGLSAEEESSVLDTMQRTHKKLTQTETAEDLLREATAHRLHVLHFDLKSTSLANYFDRLQNNLLVRGELSSLLEVAQQAHSILKARFGEKHEAIIYVTYSMANAHFLLKAYSESIRIAESLLPVSRPVLGGHHDTTKSILMLLCDAHSAAGHQERAIQYRREFDVI